ncbi:MAG: hypothetical protein LBC02_13925 [Planctomycetaceae bacterium]|jgi:hypothetical protein|nr:hypothetical protein [Planctomycetaceae bacterium]
MSDSNPNPRKPNTKSILIAAVILFIVFTCYIISAIQRQYRVQGTQSDSLLISPKTVKFGGEIISGELFRGMETARFEKDKELVAEIKKVMNQKETPSEIFKNNPSGNVNVAIALNNAFRLENNEELNTLRNAAPKEDEWGISDETLEQLSEILTRFETKRLTIRNILNRPDSCFYFIFKQDEEFGEIIDIQAADYLEDYFLLEEYAIAGALRDGRIEDALDSLVYVFRIAQLTATIGVPAARSQAALIRLRAVDVMQTIVLNQKFNKRYLNGLYAMIREQLEHWTPDRTVWVADRASGLRTYHRILQYGLGAALTPAEINDLEKRDLLMFIERKQKKRKKNTTDNKNENENENENEENEIKETIILKNDFLHGHVSDEIFYLRSMQKVINVSEKPFYQRLSVLSEVTDEVVRAMDQKESEPVIAEILLRGIVELMRLHAQDRAACEMTFLAMSVSLEKPSFVSLTSNPFSEKGYDVNQIEDADNPKNKYIQVSFPDIRKPFRVLDYRVKKINQSKAE